jgi:hypothetical protein
MDFDALVHSIAELHHRLQVEATKVINVSLTLRNWLIGWHIADYELRGEDPEGNMESGCLLNLRAD